jgi:hypothetical protein
MKRGRPSVGECVLYVRCDEALVQRLDTLGALMIEPRGRASLVRMLLDEALTHRGVAPVAKRADVRQLKLWEGT